MLVSTARTWRDYLNSQRQRRAADARRKGRGECCTRGSQRPTPEVAEVLQQEQVGRRRAVLHLQRDRTDTAHPGTTRREHLLDLVLSSVPEMKTEVLPLIADDKPVTATLKLSVSHVVAGRKVWRF